MRVLVVDDEPAITELLEEVLGRMGHEIDIVGDGPAALARVEATAYDAVVLDVRMAGGVSGLDVFEALRAAGSSLADRTVFICADLAPEIRARIASYGRPIIPKPFELAAFADVLRSLAVIEPRP